jgi:hypothetical protein
MKKQLFAVLMALVLTMTGVAIAQDYQATPPVNETEPVNGPDVDVDAGANAQGALDVDVSRTGDADTDATGVDEGGALGDEDTTTGVAGDSDLPATASELPTVALFGLLAMAAAFAVRFLRA